VARDAGRIALLNPLYKTLACGWHLFETTRGATLRTTTERLYLQWTSSIRGDRSAKVRRPVHRMIPLIALDPVPIGLEVNVHNDLLAVDECSRG
jgi:hypothetical protein